MKKQWSDNNVFPTGIVARALFLLLSGCYLLVGCGGEWPPPPGVEERGRSRTDTWETLRKESPWKKPLAQDPIYQLLGEIYSQMEDLDRRAENSGWKFTDEYRQIRFKMDKYYAQTRSVVYRLRSSGAEGNPLGQQLLEWWIKVLEDYLKESLVKADKFEQS